MRFRGEEQAGDGAVRGEEVADGGGAHEGRDAGEVDDAAVLGTCVGCEEGFGVEGVGSGEVGGCGGGGLCGGWRRAWWLFGVVARFCW